jgi:hypothetical protein
MRQVRSAKTYWHVQAPDSPGVSRIYPKNYEPKVVGMMWSMLAQEQVRPIATVLPVHSHISTFIFSVTSSLHFTCHVVFLSLAIPISPPLL